MNVDDMKCAAAALDYVEPGIVLGVGTGSTADIKTDNGNIILYIHNVTIAEPVKLEQAITQIAGVITGGLFAP